MIALSARGRLRCYPVRALLALGLALLPACRAASAQPPLSHPALEPRAGVVVAAATSREALDLLGPVWYYTYGVDEQVIDGHQRVLLVRPHYDEDRTIEVVRRRPGAWWMVGNEPNDPHQDDLSPGAYAAFFHRFATAARATDSTVRIASAGIANADCEWAAAFRDSYREQYGEFPAVDAWNIHNYILEPDRDQLDLAEFQRRIVAFRTWMDEIGEGDKPLFLSEFGALFGLSEGHLGRSAEDPERIAAFLEDAVAWLSATDHVQHFAWFATGTNGQFNGDLYDSSGALTPVGRAYHGAIRQEVG